MTNNLFKKLVDIRKSVEYLQKTEKGNQGAMYVDPAVLLQKIRSKMDEYGVLLYPSISEPTIEQIEAPTKNNPNNKGFLSKQRLQYTWIDSDSGEKLTVDWFATGNHLTDPSMAFGGAMTYSERYFMLKFFQIPTSKDDPEFFKQKTKMPEYINKEQAANIQALLDEISPEDTKALMNWLKVQKIEDIPENKYQTVVAAIERKRNANI